MRVTSVHKRKVARRRSSHAQTDSTEAQPSRAYGRAYPSMLRRAARGVSIGQSGATPHSALDDLVLWTTSCTWPSFWLVARILLLLPRCSLPLLLCGWCAGGGGGAPASVMAAHAFFRRVPTSHVSGIPTPFHKLRSSPIGQRDASHTNELHAKKTPPTISPAISEL